MVFNELVGKVSLISYDTTWWSDVMNQKVSLEAKAQTQVIIQQTCQQEAITSFFYFQSPLYNNKVMS